MRADVLTIPAPWAVDRFGFAVAAELWVRIPTALAAAIGRAVSARRASRLADADAVDDPRWPVPYEELGAHLRNVDGAAIARAPRTRYPVVVVRNHVLLPWCYGPTGAVSMRDVPPGGSLSRLAREFVQRLGGPRHRRHADPDLPHDDECAGPDQPELAELGALLGRPDSPPKVLIAGYACTADHGLLRVCLGEAAVAPGGLAWQHVEDLPLPPPTIPRPRPQRFL